MREPGDVAGSGRNSNERTYQATRASSDGVQRAFPGDARLPLRLLTDSSIRGMRVRVCTDGWYAPSR
jgi:hypothetical protein